MFNLLSSFLTSVINNPEITKLIKLFNDLNKFLVENIYLTYSLIALFIFISFLFFLMNSTKAMMVHNIFLLLALIGNFFASLTIFYDRGFNNLGWDKKSICRWTELSQEFQNVSIYSVQLIDNINTLNYNAPTFSLYYPPAIIDTVFFQCSIDNFVFNILGLCFFVAVSFIISKSLKNVSFLETLLLIQFGLSVYYWIFKSGQFFIFETSFLVLGLIAIKNNKEIRSVIFFVIFGIQKIYFLLFAFLLNKKRALLNIAMLTLIIANLVNYNLVYDYFQFWFSSNGYVFGERVGYHSFFDEKLSRSSISTLFLIKEVFFNLNFINTLEISSQRLLLLLTTFFLSLIVYFLFRQFVSDSTEKVNVYLKALLITVLFPLLKPYSLIIYLIIVLFISNELKQNYFLFSFSILIFPNFISYTAMLRMDNSIDYPILEFSQLYILIIHFLTTVFLVKFKKEYILKYKS